MTQYGEDEMCLSHSHENRAEEALCSLRFQREKLRVRVAELEQDREAIREGIYQRRCVSCKYARVTVAHPDDHPLAARTYCGNDDSPAYDRDVSFAGDDTCGCWEKGIPEHDEEHMPLTDERPYQERRKVRRGSGIDRRKCGEPVCTCQKLMERRHP
jgi:hypothetical protein